MNAGNPSPGKIFLQTAGIDSVVWIDDEFSKNTQASLVEELRMLITLAYENQLKLSVKPLEDITPDVPPEIKDKLVEERLPALADKLPDVIKSVLSEIGASKPDLLKVRDELSATQFQDLLGILKPVVPLSFKEWSDKKADIIATATAKTLFLVDREALKEDLGKEYGDTIIEELAATANFCSHCVMLTHTVTAAEADGLRKAIVTKSNGKIPGHHFAVMSKRDIGWEPEKVEAEFSQAACAAFAGRLCFELTDKAAVVMAGSLKGAAEDLSMLSIDDIDSAIFESSMKEGAPELDVITRILALRQRDAVTSLLAKEPTLVSKLVKLRAMRGEGVTVASYNPDGASRGKLYALRRAEVVSSAESINTIHSPLSCGDIFQRLGRAPRYYILLRQGCDLMVRDKTGRRNAKEAIFAPIEVDEKPLEKDEISEPFEFRLDGIGKDGSDWIIDFRHAGVVDLKVLDMAVFSPKGEVKLSLADEPLPGFLPGIKGLFEKLKTEIAGKKAEWPKARRISYGETVKDAQGEWIEAKQTVNFKYQRIGRINQPWAQAILGSFAAYHTRSALDHNFARELAAD